MQWRWQLLEDLGVLTDEPEERGPPRCQRHRIDQSQRPVAGAVQQMRPQRDGAAEVMGDHERFVQPPVAQQLGEDPALGGQGHILVRGLARHPVAGHVPDEHLVLTCERTRDGTPDEGGERRAVQQDDGLPTGLGSQPVPAHVTGCAGERPGQLPFGHGCRSLHVNRNNAVTRSARSSSVIVISTWTAGSRRRRVTVRRRLVNI